tara:strand:- start:319 stop:606 length:288 start_codon:yes stop_codon:yes gene_type:complete
MNISKLILIDIALVIAAIPFIFLLKVGKKNLPFYEVPRKKSFYKRRLSNSQTMKSLLNFKKLQRIKVVDLNLILLLEIGCLYSMKKNESTKKTLF